MEISLVHLIMVNEKIYLVINESQPKNGSPMMNLFKSFIRHCIFTTTMNNIITQPL
ncbi:hypothetical protein IMPR6_90182 [Imperialibacter sp. EC-SDR9]|nr:hypothetical protein IMPERIA75_370011 [Imperialibacter sp. 75]CAD5298868.1 hypothetical protein IMPERIA89_740097 [Imperialibacter sp. 89]VVT35713.1 hypothetical protein IMPR6_90182 [Imperialibacter sp. EC-SDR9]